MKEFNDFLMEANKKSPADVADEIRRSDVYLDIVVDEFTDFDYNIDVFWMKDGKLEYNFVPAKKYVMPITYRNNRFYATPISTGELDEENLDEYADLATMTARFVVLLNKLARRKFKGVPRYEDFE